MYTSAVCQRHLALNQLTNETTIRFIHPVKMVGGIMAMVLIVGLVMLEQVHLPRENQTIAAVVSTLVITSYAFSSIVLVITEVFLIMLGTIHFTSMYGIRWVRFH